MVNRADRGVLMCANRLRAVATGMALLAALASCGTPGSTTGNPTLDDALAGVDVGGLGDVAGLLDGVSLDGFKLDGILADGSTDQPDIPADACAPGACDPDSSTDDVSADSDVATTGCEFSASPAPGDPGAACTSAADCDSGVCIDGPVGKICTQSCTSCCPTGFKCEIYGSGIDATTVCQFKQKAICRPCDKDAECAALSKDSLCVKYAGGAGGFCGAACDKNSECPAGYTCEEAQGEKGSAKQCVKSSGECTCSPAAIADGAQTTCKIQNESGTCTGVRKCTAAGLTTCPAQTPAAETCGNATDDDCNGQTDEDGADGCKTLWSDGDDDGDGKVGSASKCMCAATGLYTANTATDCDDAQKAINGKAVEVCDGVDNDCDGNTDEDCDDDGDGFCDADMAVVGDPVVCKKGKKDCNDNKAEVNPGALEQCGNGQDDDCDGVTDAGTNISGAVPFYQDTDNDGYGTGDPKSQCGAIGTYSATKTGDCADNDPQINPGVKELCANQKDDDCNNLVDEANAQGCVDYYVDLDTDGFGAATPTCLCAPDLTYTTQKGGDCNDGKLAINPSVTETCNGADDDCDGETDELDATGCTIFYIDVDGDKFGEPSSGLCLCQKNLLSSTSDGSDCNDDNADVHPGVTEKCDGLDNGCNGLTDEQDAQGCTAYYMDGDSDTYGDPGSSLCLCAAGPVYKVTNGTDCDDKEFTIHPGAKEFCDSVDNNCIAGTDEAGALGCTTMYRDQDGDTYGDSSDYSCMCAKQGEYSADKGGDCMDTDKEIKPKALEQCDGKDNDCDGSTDPVNSDGCDSWYVDADSDGYGTFLKPSKCLCVGLPGYATATGDCADGDITVNPGALEVCNGKDDDCDQVKDPIGTSDCKVYYLDADNDKYGQSNVNQCACAPVGLFTAVTGADCDDGKGAMNPGMTELCNGVDDNCDTQTDEGLIFTYYTDNDLDGYGQTATAVNLCGPDATHKVATPGDCDDVKFGVNPGVAEVCNGADDNCNNSVDENLPTSLYYLDSDADGYGTGVGTAQCGPIGGFTATVAGDCNDGVTATNPGATELCNLVDDNCAGGTDEGLATTTYYQDLDSDGYGSAASNVQCGPLGNYTKLLTGDCNDGSGSINPSASEICTNGIDENCNNVADDGCTPDQCTVATLVDFENQDLTGWTLTSQTTPTWALYTPGFSGSYSLEFGDVANTHGYTPYEFSDPFFDSVKHTIATKSLTVPAFAKIVTISVDWEPYVKISSFGGTPKKGVDSTAKMVITFNGQTVTLNSTSTIGKSNVSFLLSPSPATSTPMTIKFDLSQGMLPLFNEYTLDPSGFVGIDDIRTTCL